MDLNGKKIAFLLAPEGIEQVELTQPWQAVEKAGGTPRLVWTGKGTVQADNHLDKGDTFDVDQTLDSANIASCDGLVLPGGVANPDFLRTQPTAVAFTRSLFDVGKPVAANCRASWTLIEAGVVEGRRLTSWPSLHTDLRKRRGHLGR